MTDILIAVGYAIIYLALGTAILAGSFWLLDVITPGHHLGHRLKGEVGDELDLRTGLEPSYSAAVVTSAWLIGQGLIIFTAIWTNADSSLGWTFVWTAVFGIIGALLLAITFIIHDVLTPGNLADEVCAPGKAVPLAYTTAASLLAISAIVCASIA